MMRRQVLRALLLVMLASWSLAPDIAQSQTPSAVGEWALGPVWDIAPIHMMLLPTGKVMSWPGDYVNGDDARLWDPESNILTIMPKAQYDLFCAGHAFMADGTMLVPGGNVGPGTTFQGLPNTSIYNPFTNAWTRVADMNAGRWYPTTTTTGLGEVLVMTGTIDSVQMENPLPQVWQPASQTWRSLTNALLKIYNYSWVYWTPFGNAVVAGPQKTTRYLDITGTGAWTDVTSFNFPNIRDYGSSVMYDPWHILIAGGGQPPTKTAEILDLSAANPTWQTTNPMAFPRRHMNMTLLPDDNVLVTGGTSGDGFNNTTAPVYPSEMWNPSTQAWTTMASQTVGRFYHSNAMLLPDGRVLSTGGNYTHQTEIYSPPYLFKGARPTIASAPASAAYSETFFVGTPDATNIANVRLIRLPAVTHAFDQNQRIVSLNFAQTTGGLNITAPSDPNRAPIGHYMLFLLNGTGVPSVAKIIQIGASPTPPVAPGNLAATPVSSSSISLTWTDQSINESGFKIERAQGAGSFSQVGTVGLNITTYTDSALAASTSYSYRVRATNTSGDSLPSNTANATTLGAGTTPGAPSGLVATAASNTAINLAWTDQSNNETGFKIERKIGTGAFSPLITVGANVTTYANTGLTANTTYSYRVRSTNTSGGDSEYSNIANATTSGLINVATATSDGGFAYLVNQGFGTPGDTSAAPTQSVLRIYENGIELGPAHTVHANIRSQGLGRFSHWGGNLYFSASNNTDPRTNGRTYTYRIGFPPAAPPPAPTSLVAAVSSNSAIALTWADQSASESGFKIERALGAGAFSAVATVGPNVTTYQDSGLTASTTYSYRVAATNSAGDSGYSNTASETTLLSAPTAPSGLSATAVSSSRIILTWADQSTNESGFQIERAQGAGAFSAVVTVGPNVTTFADDGVYDEGLAAATTYSYRVRATNSGGDSAYSNTATATTQAATIPAAPSGLTATAASSSTITLTWEDQSDNETGFKIERALGAGAFSPVVTVGPGIRTYTDSGLTASTAYTFRVAATNTAGDSAYTNTATATTEAPAPTIPAAPTGLGATPTSSSAITLTWVDQSNNESGFKIERALGAGAFSSVVTVGADIAMYADNGLMAGSSYSYRVTATNSAGDSAYSNTASATTHTATVPAAPTGLGATATSSSAITLTWADQSTNESGFKIERALGAGAFSAVVTVGPDIMTYIDNGLTAGTAYSYRVAATNTAGDSGYSNTASATTEDPPPSPPAAPTGLGATAASSSAITLTWTDQSTNESGFKIERALGAGAFSAVVTVGADVTTYADSGLTANTAYTYRVAATNTGGDSAYSNTASATTHTATVPAAPTGLGATATSSSAITLTWVDQSNNESGFKIERALGAGAFSPVVTVGPDVTTYNDSSLTASTAYSYRVAATNSAGDSPYSNTASATTEDAAPTIPAAPTGLGATATSSSTITLTWADQSTNESGFKIERALGAGAFSPVVTVVANVTTYADSGLTAGTAYTYRVAATNTAGDSAFSNTAGATTQDEAPTIPAPPTGLGATATSTSAITLTWADQSNNETGFKIERALGAGAFSPVVTVAANVTTYADSGLTASTSYSYRVAATNGAGDSAFSNTASATTQDAAPTIPAAPAGLGATATSSSTITLTWADQSNNESGFKIERALGAGAFSPVVTVAANVTTYADSALTANTAYSYRVRATNAAGDSASSNTASATTWGLVNVTAAAPNGGFAYLVNQNFGTPGDSSASPSISVLRIFENGIELGPPHSLHANIRSLGAGRFSHWGNNLYFSASDNTDPRTNGKAYTFRIGFPPAVPPGAPTGLGATATSSSTITLTWSDQSNNEAGFKIERAEGAGAFSPVVTVGANVTAFADSGLTASTEYSYRVAATNTAGDSAYSNTAIATTQDAGSTIPAAPTGLGATATSSSAITLTWVDQSNNELGFKIERALGAGAFSPVATVGANVTTYADSGLTANTAYTYRVAATNTAGDSPYSNTASATTAPTIPAAPTGLGATATSSSTITLTWADHSADESGFKIERALGAGAFSPVVTVGANITTYADSGLSASTAYTYRVAATNTSGDSAYSNTASATTDAPPPTPPAAPTGLGATATSSSTITLTWADQSNNESGFKIERALGAGAFAPVVTVAANITTYADSGLTANTAYSYRVQATNTAGDSAYSNTASATTSGVINVAAASANGGFAYLVNQNFGTPGDTSATPTISVLRIFENGIELGPPHSLHANIRSLGLGRFSHWGSNLYFSASDNTDPRTNGRTYTYRIGPS